VGTAPDYRDAPVGYRLVQLNADGSFVTQEHWLYPAASR
jgi:hypothetical protein